VYEKRNRSADYLIGHAYFLNNKTIEDILLVKVIPLLMEYFSGKTTIVAEVFSETAYQVRYDEINYKWEVKKK
jgi:5-methylcytosine-specific restriction protein B